MLSLFLASSHFHIVSTAPITPTMKICRCDDTTIVTMGIDTGTYKHVTKTCNKIKKAKYYIDMILSHYVIVANFLYVVVKSRVSNRSDLIAMFWQKWTEKRNDVQHLLILFITIHVNIDLCEKIIEIGGHNRSNEVIKRRHRRVVENVYRYVDTAIFQPKLDRFRCNQIYSVNYILILLCCESCCRRKCFDFIFEATDDDERCTWKQIYRYERELYLIPQN